LSNGSRIWLPSTARSFAILHALRLNSARELILGEPTSTLTEREKESLFEMMRTLRMQGLAIIYITHHLDEVFEIADRFTVFRGGRKVAARGACRSRT
jgi:ABC-type sugar transport system ATPase subunit